MSLRVSQIYGVLKVSYLTARYFRPASQVAIQRMLPDWAHFQGISVVQREQHQYEVNRKYQKP